MEYPWFARYGAIGGQTGALIAADLVALDLAWDINGAGTYTSPAITAGDVVRFRTTAQNIGTVAMPAGTVATNHQLDVTWLLAGEGSGGADLTINWSDQDEASLAPSATRLLTATGGPNSGANYWIATAGSHTLIAWVNSQGRKTETNYANNTFSRTVTVSSGATGSPGLFAGEIFGWTSVTMLDSLLASNATGAAGDYSPLSMNDMLTHGWDGHVISLGDPGTSAQPEWLRSEFSVVASNFGRLLLGMNLASINNGAPRSQAGWDAIIAQWRHTVDECQLAGGDGMALDPEPYTFIGPHQISWNTSNSDVGPNGDWPTWSVPLSLYHDNGVTMGAYAAARGLGHIEFYLASDSSWPGSAEDDVQINAGNLNVYASSGFASFCDGLIEAGCTLNMLDAAFHQGVQSPGCAGDAFCAVQKVATRVVNRFPAGATGAVMIWPDDNEGSNPHLWSAADLTYMTQAVQAQGTGPFSIYSHPDTMLTNKLFWHNTVLPSILAGK